MRRGWRKQHHGYLGGRMTAEEVLSVKTEFKGTSPVSQALGQSSFEVNGVWTLDSLMGRQSHQSSPGPALWAMHTAHPRSKPTDLYHLSLASHFSRPCSLTLGFLQQFLAYSLPNQKGSNRKEKKKEGKRKITHEISVHASRSWYKACHNLCSTRQKIPEQVLTETCSILL